MHELSITQDILDIAIKTAKEQNALKIKKINLIIGQFTYYQPESIEFFMNIIAKDTIAEGVKIEVKSLPLEVECNDCHSRTIIKEPYEFVCSKCNCYNLKIITGKEMYVDSIDIEN